MSEQADRSSAGSRALARRNQDRHLRHEGSDSSATPRRTIVIRGQVADRYNTPRSRPSRRHPISASYGMRMRPERAALWAVLLGLALVIVAIASANL
jgi:hypothetical protein